jgi:hypothetical protein
MIHLTEVEPKGSDMYRCYFSISNKEQHIHKCIKCADHLRKCNIAHGYQNLYTHVRHCHKDYKEVNKIIIKMIEDMDSSKLEKAIENAKPTKK